jgi:thiol-disulfide isomerase/thioredoxin
MAAAFLSCGVALCPEGVQAQDRLTLILFGASWCAPCVAEVRAISGIAAAASGNPVVLAWTDDGISRLRIVVPANVQVASKIRTEQLWNAHGRSAAGLPYSVMLDGAGQRCASWSRPLSPEAVAAMRRACRSN